MLVSGVVSAKVPSYIHPHTGTHTFLLIDGLESFPHRDMLCGMQCRPTTSMWVQCSVTLGRNQASNKQHSEVGLYASKMFLLACSGIVACDGHTLFG